MVGEGISANPDMAIFLATYEGELVALSTAFLSILKYYMTFSRPCMSSSLGSYVGLDKLAASSNTVAAVSFGSTSNDSA
jgi:hypothetical protein